MTDRPILELHGRRYQRERGAWIDVTTRMSASAAVAIELNSLARRDSEFWTRCRNQDFDDDPRNKRKILRPIIIENDSNRFTRVAAESAKSRKVATRHGFEWRFNDSRELIITCDIEAGWRATERSWRFGAADTVDLPGGWRLHCAVTLVEDTWGRWQRRVAADVAAVEVPMDDADPDSACPRFSSLDKTCGAIRVSLREGTCMFALPLLDRAMELNGDLPWVCENNRWSFRVAESGLYERPIRTREVTGAVCRPFRVELHATLHQPRPAKPESTYEYDTPLPSAGLPSLGKRKRA